MREGRFVVEGITIEKPDMWLSEKYGIKRNFKLTERMKENGINENQLGVVKVEDGYVYYETFIQLTSVEDRGDYYYIGFQPIGKDIGRFGHGCDRIYKHKIPEYGALGLVDITRTININTGEAK